jgi:hypothetical protein
MGNEQSTATPQHRPLQTINGVEYWLLSQSWNICIPKSIDHVIHPNQSEIVIREADGSLTIKPYRNPRFMWIKADGKLSYIPPIPIPILFQSEYQHMYCEQRDGLWIYKDDYVPLDHPEAILAPIGMSSAY